LASQMLAPACLTGTRVCLAGSGHGAAVQAGQPYLSATDDKGAAGLFLSPTPESAGRQCLAFSGKEGGGRRESVPARGGKTAATQTRGQAFSESGDSLFAIGVDELTESREQRRMGDAIAVQPIKLRLGESLGKVAQRRPLFIAGIAKIVVKIRVVHHAPEYRGWMWMDMGKTGHP